MLNWKKPGSLLGLFLALFAVENSAIAAPYTVHFAASSTYYSVGGGIVDASKIGLPFSGSLNIDLANSQWLISYNNPGVTDGGNAGSYRGCFGWYNNGVCEYAVSTGTANITAMAVNSAFTPAGTYAKYQNGAGDNLDYSYVMKRRTFADGGSITAQDEFQILSQQFDNRRVGDIDSGNFTEFHTHQFLWMYVSTEDNSFLGDPSDLIGAVDSSHLPFGQQNLTFQSQIFQCDYALHVQTSCTWGPFLEFAGSLTSLRVEPSLAVPEPAPLALVLLGLAGLAATRRRQAM